MLVAVIRPDEWNLPLFVHVLGAMLLVGTLLLAGLVLFARFAWFYFTQEGPTGHVQSLVVGSVLLVFALQLVVLGVVADLLRANRVLIERTLHRVRKVELELGVRPDTLAGEEIGVGERDQV